MKVRKLALLAALPAAVMVANAQADGPEFYGKLNVSMQKNNINPSPGGTTLDNWTLDSNASRIGVKGAMDLDGTLKGIYKLEIGTDVANGDATFASRNSYIGVQGTWGTVIGGKFDTPTREVQGKVDQFNDYKMADIATVLVGEVRPAHIAMYSSPKLADMPLTVNVAIIPGQNTGATPGNNNNGPTDGSSASVVYDTDALYLAFGIDNHVDSGQMWLNDAVTATSIWGNETNVYRLAGQMKLDQLVLGAIIQSAKDVTQNSSWTNPPTNTIPGGVGKQTGGVLSAAYTMDKCTFKAQFGHSSTHLVAGNPDTKGNWLSLGLDHSLGKGAKAYAYIADAKIKDVTPGVDQTNRTVGVGLEQKF